MSSARACRPVVRQLCNLHSKRAYSSVNTSPAQPAVSPFAPRHLLSIADLTPSELNILVQNAFLRKQAIKSGKTPPEVSSALAGKLVAIMMTKRSTRTRISTEGAITALGGQPMFLGAGDIQLGVNESLYDTSVVISSMTSAIVARVHAHADITGLAKHSTVPVINALSDLFHPKQIIADYLTMYEAFSSPQVGSIAGKGLGLAGLKVAWIGDANNILYDLAIGAMKLGVHISVATPKGYEMPHVIRQLIESSKEGTSTPGTLQESNVPEEALKDADVIVTDTWISMGQEEEKAKRLKDFEGFQVTPELIKRGGAKEGWRFMHCLPDIPRRSAMR